MTSRFITQYCWATCPAVSNARWHWLVLIVVYVQGGPKK